MTPATPTTPTLPADEAAERYRQQQQAGERFAFCPNCRTYALHQDGRCLTCASLEDEAAFDVTPEPVLDISEGDGGRDRIYPHQMAEPIFANDGASVGWVLICIGAAIAFAFAAGWWLGVA